MPKRSTTGRWLAIACVVASAALVWILAVVVLPQDGWLRPGQVTAFGLVVVFALVVWFLVLERRENEQEDRDRAARRARRRR